MSPFVRLTFGGSDERNLITRDTTGRLSLRECGRDVLRAMLPDTPGTNTRI
jgi:hypothetical protein